MDLLKACKIAYLKFHLCDDSISESEATDALMDALCNEIGDDAFCRFVDNNAKRIKRGLPLTKEPLKGER